MCGELQCFHGDSAKLNDVMSQGAKLRDVMSQGTKLRDVKKSGCQAQRRNK